MAGLRVYYGASQRLLSAREAADVLLLTTSSPPAPLG